MRRACPTSRRAPPSTISGPARRCRPPAAAASTAPRAAAEIALAEVDANSRLDGTQLLYRLGYADSNELRPYGQSRWSQPPAQLLRQRLREALSAGRTVLGPEESATIARSEGRLPDALRVTLEEFSQYFESPERSVGLVRVSATLTRSQPARRPGAGPAQLHGPQAGAERRRRPAA